MIKHSVLENHSSLIFCNSIFCPFLCFFYSANSLPLPIAYFVNVGLTQEIPFHLIVHTFCCLLLHNFSKFSYVHDFQISLKSFDYFHIKRLELPAANSLVVQAKSLGEVHQQETKILQFCVK